MNHDLSGAYGIFEPALIFDRIDGNSSGSSHYIPSQRRIVIVGKLSVVTYLHEFAHALELDERDACRWSINLFKRCFPRHYGRLVHVGHMLIRVIRHYVREVRPKIRNAEVMHQLFLTKTGSPYTSNKMTKKMRMLLKRYGLDDKSAHSFRHFFCTDLLRRGVALHETKALMRHRDVRSTMVYSHATVDDLRAAVNRRVG
ncbi:MAG: site-specific integrase [Phycisphaerae bacterium]|nr:site-specific integrase [Phycisphaerae bacterium]